MIQQKQSHFEQRFNILNENRQNIIQRVKKQPLPIYQRQRNPKINKATNLLYHNPQNYQKSRIQLPDLYVHSPNKYSYSADKYKLQSRVPSSQEYEQKNIPNGLQNYIKKTNNQAEKQRQLHLSRKPLHKQSTRYKQNEQQNNSPYQQEEKSQHQNQNQNNYRQSKLMRRCCHEYQNQIRNTQNLHQSQLLKRHKSYSGQQIINKLKMRKLQPLKFNIKNKMDFNNMVSVSSHQHQMNLRMKKNMDKFLSKDQQKELANKLSKPKQSFHKCDKRNCGCFMHQNQNQKQKQGSQNYSNRYRQSSMKISQQNKIQRRLLINGHEDLNDNKNDDNLRMKKTRRMGKLKPIKTQPTTIQVQESNKFGGNHRNNISKQPSQIDILAESRVQVQGQNTHKTRRTLEEVSQFQKSAIKPQDNYEQQYQELQHQVVKIEAKQFQVQTEQVCILQKTLINQKPAQKQHQKVKVNGNSSGNSLKGSRQKSSKLNKSKVQQKQSQIIDNQSPYQKSSKNSRVSNASKNNQIITQSNKKNNTKQDKQQTLKMNKLKISQKLHNSHQYDFVIELKTSKQQKFKNKILEHLRDGENNNETKEKKQQQKNIKLFSFQVNNKQSHKQNQKIQISQDNETQKIEKTAHFNFNTQKDQKLKSIQQNESKKEKLKQLEQIPIELGLLTVQKKNPRQVSPDDKLEDSFIKMSTSKSNSSIKKKSSNNQFNKHSSISKTSKNHIIFRVPVQEEYLDFIKKYKCLSSDFNLKSLIVQDNFKALAYKDGFYFGQMQNEKLYGRGVFLTQIQLFEGVFQKDLKVKGCLKTSDGLYEGQFFNNLRHGQGRFMWNNGQIFEGQWRLGTKNGYGKWQAPDGSRYEGQWNLNMQHGKGKFTHPTSTYEGDFQKFLKNGKGVETFPNGDKYEGQYKDGKPNGFGKYMWGDGAYYQGTFHNGLRQGTGKWHQNSDTLYQGEFFQDQKHGHGIQFYKNGNYFEGQFHNGIIKSGTLFDPYKNQIKREQKQKQKYNNSQCSCS